MANSLLDFVMSLVRDPDAAARYAENPDQAIRDANLTDVTSADVSNLIPVVSESLSSSVPTAGTDGVIADMAGNVWASGAATAAFDAFDDHIPDQGIDDAQSLVTTALDQPLADGALDGSTELPSIAAGDSGLVDELDIDDSGPVFDDAIADARSLIDDQDFGADAPNFDIFE